MRCGVDVDIVVNVLNGSYSTFSGHHDLLAALRAHTIVFVAEPLPKNALDSAGDPTKIVQQTFDTERRGFNQEQVQVYLRALADSLQDAQQREADMRSRVGKAVRRAEKAEQALREISGSASTNIDENRQVGEEVTSVLDAARAAGEQRVAAAEGSAAKLIKAAKADATKMRAEAESLLQQCTDQAEARGADIVAEARKEAQDVQEQAHAEAELTLSRAVARVTNVRNECDGLVREAEEARAQILEDMERRRREARAQVERLRVGRDRLLSSYEVVRRTLEETTVELKSSLKEAKIKGDSAARAITAEPLAGRDQLEVELLDAKMIGRIKISEPPANERPLAKVAKTKKKAQALNSAALPRPIDPPQLPHVDMRSASKKRQPQAPASAPKLTATPGGAATGTDSSIELANADLDAELAKLDDENLDVVEPSDEIEEVVALPIAEADRDPAAINLFEMLRAQSSPAEEESGAIDHVEAGSSESVSVSDETADVEPESDVELKSDSASGSTPSFPGIEAQRDAVIADAAKQLEKRLKRALADEQNELLASLRGAPKQRKVDLTSIVGDVDHHVHRYLVAINEVAVVTYGAGAALIDADPGAGLLPAGAVEELLTTDVVLPIRECLESLNALDVEAADMHVDPVRSFYRTRKTDHLGFAASRLANLLTVAGVCDALPNQAALPWDASQSTPAD